MYNFSFRLSLLCLVTIALAILPAWPNPASAQARRSGESEWVAEALAPFDGDFAEIRLAGKQHYLHRSGRIMVDKPEQYGAPICIAVKDGAYGAINRKGDVVAAFNYDRIYYEYEDNKKTDENREYLYFLAVVQLDGKFGAFDTLGNTVAQPVYDELNPINELVIAAKQSGKWGLLSLKNGHVVLPFDYDGLEKQYGLGDCIQVTTGNGVGLRSADGQRELIPPVYEGVRVLPLPEGAVVAAERDASTLLLDTLGHVLAEVPYDYIQAEGERIRVEKDGKRGWLTADGNAVIPPAYDESSEWRGGRCVVSKENRKGVITADGKTVLPCQYDEIRLVDRKGGEYAEPLFIVSQEAGKQGLFDMDGHAVLPANYDDIRLGEAGTVGYVWAMKDGKYGIFDQKGKELLPFTYEQPAYGHGLSVQDMPPTIPVIAVPDGNRTGLYDLKRAQWILKPEYQQIEWQLGSFIKATNHTGTEDAYQIPVSAYFTSQGTLLIAPKEYLFVDAVDTDRYVVKETARGYWKTSLFDRSGKQLYANKNWEFDFFRFNKLLVPDSISIGKNGTYFQSGWLKVYAEDNLFVDRSGGERRFEGLDYVGDFYNGKAIATKHVNGVDQIGMIDSTGKILLAPVYTDIDRLYDSDLLRVSKAGKYGLVDINGNVVVEALYDRIDQSSQKGLLEIQRDGKRGIIDVHGRVILPTEYEAIQFYDAFFVVTASGKKGLIALDGRILAAPQYDEISLNSSYYGYFPALVQQGDHWTYIDLTDTGQAFHITGKTKLGY